ncbi:MAG: hypothetical protein HYV09_28010 [Deltaproteobacteria bacterium]|nr:hypothetical protein [Deltaproteobacteria bacterium]
MRGPFAVMLALMVGIACAKGTQAVAPSPGAPSASTPSAAASASGLPAAAASPTGEPPAAAPSSEPGPSMSAWIAASTELPYQLKIPDAVLKSAIAHGAMIAVVEIKSVKPTSDGNLLASWGTLGPIRQAGPGGVEDARISGKETRLVPGKVMVLVFRHGSGAGAGVVYGVEEIPRARAGEFVTAYSVRCSQLD